MGTGMGNTPKWILVLFGSVIILMGTLILGALIGVIPTDEGGVYLAPTLVIASLGLGLVFCGILLWIPKQTPPRARTFFALIVMALFAVVCNWTAFAPGVVYYSEEMPYEYSSSETQIGGRIVFVIVALILDYTLVATLVSWVRQGREATEEGDDL
jgi:cytochrome bd-type quinol oxidase subunit 2